MLRKYAHIFIAVLSALGVFAALATTSVDDTKTGIATGGSSVDLASPGPIGGTTPSTGAFTTLSSTGGVSVPLTTSATSAFASTGYSLTGSNATSMIDLAGTWNTTGTPSGIKLNITNTASAAGSSVLDLQIGGTQLFQVWTDGRIFLRAASAEFILNGSDGVRRSSFGISTTRYSSGHKTTWSANASGPADGSVDLYLGRGAAAATLQQGDANAASPVAQTLQAQGSRSGTDTNVGGANYTIQSGTGTGTGTASTLIFRSPSVVASGTGAQTQLTGLTISSGVMVMTSYTVATLPTCVAGLAGGRAFVTDASTTLTLGIGGTFTGGGANKVPGYCDGTDWRYG